MSRRYASRRYAGGLGPSRIRTRIPKTRQLGQWVSLRKTLRFRVRLQLSQSRCLSLLLAMSGRVFLFSCVHAAMNLRPPSVTASTQPSAFTAIVFQSPVMPYARMSLCTQSIHSLYTSINHHAQPPIIPQHNHSNTYQYRFTSFLHDNCYL